MAAIDDFFPAHYTTVVADPPWNERGGGKIKRGADRHYPLMKTPEIVDLLVNDCEPLQQLNPVRSCLFLRGQLVFVTHHLPPEVAHDRQLSRRSRW